VMLDFVPLSPQTIVVEGRARVNPIDRVARGQYQRSSFVLERAKIANLKRVVAVPDVEYIHLKIH